MANKFLDNNGLLYFWQKIVNKIKENIVNDLTSTAVDKSLSAYQGKVLNDKLNGINTNLENLGAGDMLKSVYDIDNNGQVDKADDADKLGGQAPDYYATAEAVEKKANDADLAKVAKTGSYNDLIDKPTDFAPSTHSHAMTDVTGLGDALADKAEKVHNHTTSEITDFNTEMAKKANVSHIHEQSEINGLEEIIGDVTEIAQGKCDSYVFDTVDEMNTWLAETNNTANLKTGDVFLIRAVDVPDYWWDADTSSAQILETTKVNLTTISNAEIDTIVAS